MNILLQIVLFLTISNMKRGKFQWYQSKYNKGYIQNIEGSIEKCQQHKSCRMVSPLYLNPFIQSYMLRKKILIDYSTKSTPPCIYIHTYSPKD